MQYREGRVEGKMELQMTNITYVLAMSPGMERVYPQIL